MIQVFGFCDHGESRVLYPKEGRCPVCDTYEEIQSLRRQVRDLEKQIADKLEKE